MPADATAAVEPRQRQHVNDRLETAPGFADEPARCMIELHLGRGIGAVAELVLQPHQRHAIEAAIRHVTRHQKTGQPIDGLRQHEECVARRR